MPPIEYRDIGRQTIFGNPIRALSTEKLMGKTLPEYRKYLEKRLQNDPVFKIHLEKLRDWLAENPTGRALSCPGCKSASCRMGICHGHDLMKAMANLDPKHPSSKVIEGLLASLGGTAKSAQAPIAIALKDRPITYTGVGSRNTPPEMLEFMKLVGETLAKKNFRLRTGDALGADDAFLKGALGALQSRDRQELLKLVEAYVPHSKTGRLPDYFIRPKPEQLAELERILRQTHPASDKLRGYGRELMARNALQVLGRDLNDPSDFLIGMLKPKELRRADWDVGGTGQAFRLAESRGIPVFDLAGTETQLKSALAHYAKKTPDGPGLDALTQLVEQLLKKNVNPQSLNLATGADAAARIRGQAPPANPLRNLTPEELVRRIREGQ